MNCIGEEVTRVRDQENQATFNLRISSHVCELEQKTGSNSDHNADSQTAKENEHENTNRLEQAQDGELSSFGARSVLLCSFEQDNGNCVVQDRFAKDDSVQFRVDLVGVENGEDGYGVGGTQGRAHAHSFDETDVQTFQRNARP